MCREARVSGQPGIPHRHTEWFEADRAGPDGDLVAVVGLAADRSILAGSLCELTMSPNSWPR
jgi:hypothetical protein